jgi:nucleosome binding factor SPN SPT16 subunit
VQEAYKTLVGVYETCLDAMKPSVPLKVVMEKAKAYLQANAPDYLPYLPKNLGSAIGTRLSPTQQDKQP